MKPFHSLLIRQIKRYFGGMDTIPQGMMDFVRAVNDAYHQADDDRNMLERSLELSSEELLQANTEQRAIFQAFPDMLFRLDKSGKVLDVRSGSQTDFFIHPERMIGTQIQTFPRKEIAVKLSKALKKVLHTKSLVRIEYTARIRGKEYHFEARLVPALTDQTIVIVRNITQQKLAQEALTETTERYRTVLEASPDPIVVYDMEGKTTYTNPAFTHVLGWTLEELKGRRIDFVPEEDWPETKLMIEKVKRGEGFSGFETRRYTKDGKIIDISMSAAVWRDPDDNPVGSVITLRDVTDQRKLETQLLQAHKREAIGILAGGVAHDFNNLLMGIKGNVELLLLQVDADHPNRKKLQAIERYIDSGAQLTRQLLGSAMGGKYEVKPTDINMLIRKGVKMFGRTAKEIHIHLNLEKEIWHVEVDRGQIEQVFLNLFLNARQAMPKGGRLSINTENRMLDNDYAEKSGIGNRRCVQVIVSDTGVGMDENTVQRIFDPFFTTKTKGRGAGLGLASTYGIIKSHSGVINVESAPGEGSTFTILLPASEKKFVEEKKKADTIMKGDECILLVDDEKMIIATVTDILKTYGYSVITASGGQEAIDVFTRKQDGIDMIILDMVMPNMSGEETFDRLREIDPDIKVLLSSGYSIDGRARSLLERGCNGFIQKPFDIILLSRKIREVLDGP